jgi:hypothetical protein
MGLLRKNKNEHEGMDPLDRSIEISDEERRTGALSTENRKLGAMLLHWRGSMRRRAIKISATRSRRDLAQLTRASVR